MLIDTGRRSQGTGGRSKRRPACRRGDRDRRARTVDGTERLGGLHRPFRGEVQPGFRASGSGRRAAVRTGRGGRGRRARRRRRRTFDATTEPRTHQSRHLVREPGERAGEPRGRAARPDFDFDALRRRTRAAWNDALHAIEVSGGSGGRAHVLHGALPRAASSERVHDANGDYMGYDGVPHASGAGRSDAAGSTYYANFSMWDTYRAEKPLLMLVAPDRLRDMMRSLRRSLARAAGCRAGA